MSYKIRLQAIIVALAFLIFVPTAAHASEIKGFFPAALRTAAVKMIPQFEASSGNKVSVEYGAVGALTNRLQNGELADVAILSDSQIDDLQKAGKVLPGTKVGIAKVGIGVFVAKGAAKPDIASPEAFKRMLTTAKSISFGNPANGVPAGIYLVALIERLGLTSEMKPKIVLAQSGPALFDSVAKGDVEIGFNQITEIMAEDKVQLVGPLPPEVQNYTRFAGGLVATSKQQELGRALLSFFGTPEAQSAMRMVGLEPLQE
jgi:molybdate transport system substrate-binding protein